MKSAADVADEIMAWVNTGRGVLGTIAGIIADRDEEWRRLAHDTTPAALGPSGTPLAGPTTRSHPT